MTTAATSQPPLAGGQDLPADSGGLGNVTEDGGVRKRVLQQGTGDCPLLHSKCLGWQVSPGVDPSGSPGSHLVLNQRMACSAICGTTGCHGRGIPRDGSGEQGPKPLPTHCWQRYLTYNFTKVLCSILLQSLIKGLKRAFLVHLVLFLMRKSDLICFLFCRVCCKGCWPQQSSPDNAARREMPHRGGTSIWLWGKR